MCTRLEDTSTRAGIVLAVDGISFNVLKGETLSGRRIRVWEECHNPFCPSFYPRPGRIVEGKISVQEKTS
jgi:hypothetical protein